MSQNTIVRARIDEKVKSQATAVLAAMGLTVSDLLRITLTKVAYEQALPFDINPKPETIAAMAELDAGKGERHASPDALFEELGI